MDEKKIPELKNSNKKLVLIIVLAVLAVALIVLAVVNSSNKGKNNGATTSGTDQSATTQTDNNSAPTSEEAAPTNTANPTGSETATAPTPDAAVNGVTPNVSDGTTPVKEAPIEKTEPITIKMSIDASKGFNPASIDVKAGQQVTLNVTSNGSVAILVFDGGISATAIGISDGQTKDASFTAPTTRGTYSVHNDIPGRNQSCKINVK